MKKTFSTIKKTFALLTICFVALPLSSFNSQEHKLLGDMGMSRVIIPLNISFPVQFLSWAKVPSYRSYATNWYAAKMLAVGYNTNNDGDYSLLSTCQDNCYNAVTFRQKDGNKANYIENLSPENQLLIRSQFGANSGFFSFGDLVALYGDFRRTVFCKDGSCYLGSQNDVPVAFEGKAVNTFCPPAITTSQYMHYTAFGLWPPHGQFGNVVFNSVGETDYGKAAWWGDEMMRLANVNETHFSNVALTWYIGMHRLALLYANMARTNPQYWVNAMHYEASALHCLTDLFCLGHVVTARDQSSYNTMKQRGLTNNLSFLWMEYVIKLGGGIRDATTGKITLSPNSPLIFDINNQANDFMPSYFKISTDTWALWAKKEHTSHDTYNDGGAFVYNFNGSRFRIYGDGKLHLLDNQSRRVIEDAVTASVQSLFDAYQALGTPYAKLGVICQAGSGYFTALKYIPVFIETLIADPNFNKWASYADFVQVMAGVKDQPINKCSIQLLDGGNSMLVPAKLPGLDCRTFPLTGVKIGNQVWMQNNLNVSTYADGTPIPEVRDPAAWANLTTGAWCYYNNDPANGNAYGKLYNWYAVNDKAHGGLAPAGWHIPSSGEWATLSAFLGGDDNSGGAMKEIGTMHWSSPNVSATNSSGFTGVGSGYRNYSNGAFQWFGTLAYYWSSDEGQNNEGGDWALNANGTKFMGDATDRKHGFAVRCVRN